MPSVYADRDGGSEGGTPDELAAAFAPAFVSVGTRREIHRTPAGAAQPFTWQVLQPRPAAPRT